MTHTRKTRKINILDESLASKIAAGEVVERPASVLKELLENSLDAGADSISVYVAEGGKRVIRVTDNGEGMAREDARLAFVRHATSKISKEEDLSGIRTMGFRGEALYSIAAVSRTSLRTRPRGDVAGTLVAIEGCDGPKVSDDGCPEGTIIEVKDLFCNTPARLKFLRSTEAEFGRILDIFRRIALINPDKRFKLVHGSARVIETAPGGLRERITDIFGEETGKKIIEVDTPFLKGFVGTHELTYATTKTLFTFVNKRPVRDKGINRAIIDGYGKILESSRYPFAVLDLTIDPEDVDVNIHPAKSEVRFKNTKLVFDIVKTGVKGALSLPSKTAVYEDRGKSFQSVTALSGPMPARAMEGDAPFFMDERPRPATGEGARGSTEGMGELGFTGGDAKNPEFLNLDTVGQLWGEFLIAETRNGDTAEFYIVDQHGAAEREAFERFKGLYLEGRLPNQMLLLPERIETNAEERNVIYGAMAHLDRLGFEIIPFGPLPASGETFLLKSVPQLLSSRRCSALIKELAEELTDLETSSKVEEKIEEALMRIACHSVIRGPRPLTREEGNALLRRLAHIDFAGCCPHGRPVVKKISRKEIEETFGRR